MTESQREMLTAFVDGELSPAQRASVEQLVQQSADAHLLLQALQADALSLRQLPCQSIPVDLSQNKYGQGRAGQGSRAAVLRQRWRTVRWLQVAALLLITVGAGLTWMLLRGYNSKPEKEAFPVLEPRVVQNSFRPKASERASSATSERKLPTPTPSPFDVKPQDIVLVWSDLRHLLSKITQSADSYLRPVQQLAMQNWQGRAETVPGEQILTSPLTGQGNPFKSLDYRLPTLLELAELKSAESAKLFKPGAIHYLDISAQDAFQALHTLQSNFRKSGLPLLIDQELTQRQTRRLPVTVVIYVENLTVEQVQRLLQSLAKDNGMANDPILSSILLQTLDERGMKWLAGILGVPPHSLFPHDPEQQKLLGIDPTKPISDETLKALRKLSAGQGRGSKSAPTVGMALAVSVPRLAPVSKELRAAMEQRQGLQPGKVSLMILVRTAK